MNWTWAVVATLMAFNVAGTAGAQVVAPAEIKDPQLRALQAKYFAALSASAAGIASRNYPSKFYLTGALDLKGRELESPDQRSLEFASFAKQTVLLIRGNYSAIYPAAMPPEERVSRTYFDVVVPVTRAVMPELQNETGMDALTVELSQHVRKGTVLTMDRFENLAFVLPRATAAKIAETNDPAAQLAALGESTLYVDGGIVPFGEKAKAPAAAATSDYRAPARNPRESAETRRSSDSAPAPVFSPTHPDAPPGPPAQHQTELQPMLDRMIGELSRQANFDRSGKAELMVFRGVSYVRLPTVATLAATEAGSQYRLAALAFDRHISHLIRLVLPYLKGAQSFSGIDFRTTVREGPGDASDTVEFLFPLSDLRRYESFDLTGQQLIDAGFVLINGERVGLDLQSAEAVKP